MSKKEILKGTALLTAAGLSTRILGFFYKIYLSHSISAADLGLYQLVFPVLGLMTTIFGSGISTAVSQLTACKKEQGHTILLRACIISLSLSLPLTFFLFRNSSYVAMHFLAESSVAPLLSLLSFCFPFCGITLCIHGYYIGKKQARVPAFSQLFEQISRIIIFWSLLHLSGTASASGETAILAMVFGEFCAFLFCSFSLLFSKESKKTGKLENQSSNYFLPLAKLALPLTATRLVVSLLHSLEAVLIPFMLKKHGLSPNDALAFYGILSGMSLPFLFFPTAITNAFASFLLPTVSEAQVHNQTETISTAASLSIKYCLLIGLYSTFVFFLFGRQLGIAFFHNQAAGIYLRELSFICPFLYLSTSLSSIINGLGKAHITFFNTVLSLSIRILILCFFVPRFGIRAYLFSMLISQIALVLFNYFALKRQISIPFLAGCWLIKPFFILVVLSVPFYYGSIWVQKNSIHPGIGILFISAFLGICYLTMLFVFKIITTKEL